METRKYLRLSAGMVAIMALLAATNVFAQLSCTSKTTGEAGGSFTVNVVPQTQNGRTTYTYTVSGANANKLFIYVQKGLGADLVSLVDGAPSGSISYVTPHGTSASFPPPDAWKVVHHQDGVIFPSVAIGHTFALDVPERFKPEEGVTTILLGIKTTFEHCGPILGPTTPAAPTFEGSPLLQTISTKTFANGCIYDVTAGETDNIIVTMTLNPNSPPFETVCGPSGCQACTVTNSPNICEADGVLVFCPPLTLGQPPLQSEVGGTCYYPKNIKFTC
jgi:hypothetical protein